MDTYLLGQPVPLSFSTYGTDGVLAAPTTAGLTIILPAGDLATPTLDNPTPGVFVLDYMPATVGRHVAMFVSTGPGAGSAVDVFDVLAPDLSLVTVGDVEAYLGETSATPDDITGALTAERRAQADRCRIDDYTEALREALLRRVARNLAARAVPIATFTSFEGGGTSARVPQVDAEIKRLEGPYVRWTVG
jgi:hypothetical protein